MHHVLAVKFRDNNNYFGRLNLHNTRAKIAFNQKYHKRLLIKLIYYIEFKIPPTPESSNVIGWT